MSATRTAAPAQKSGTPSLTGAPTVLLQRQCACGAHAAGGECDECKKKKGLLARKASSSGAALDVRQNEVAGALASPGQPLDRDTRAFMESRFQHDFSGVRVHTDARAAGSARALQARAWTLGRDVAFATGAYAPGTPAGRRLLAHELAHVVQQDHAAQPSADAALEVSAPGDASEREADAAAARVAEGTPAPVRAQAAPEVIHRLDDDTWKAIGIIGGLGALVSTFILLASRKGAADIDNPPACGPRQLEKINPALTGARQWTKTALERVRAFKAGLQDPAHKFVREAFIRRFRSVDAPVIDKVERVVTQVQQVVAAPDFRTECHTPKTEPICEFGAAFAVRGKHQINLCAGFFRVGTQEATAAVIHELTHALVGGAPIGDRGYARERIFGGGSEPLRLTTEAALTNAESYSEFVADLALNKVFGEAPPADVIECPDDWRPLVKEAMAQAQRAAINVEAELAEAGTQASALWNPRWRALNLPGRSSPTADVARQHYKNLNSTLRGPIRIVCNANPRDACAHGDVDWSDKALILCASWKPKAAEHTRLLLAGLFGWASKVDDAEWRRGLAQVAADTLTSARYGQPQALDVFGSPAWTPDLLRIHFLPQIPTATRSSYEESGAIHQRMSQDQPVYRQPACQSATLPFQFHALFWIDATNTPRPGPYTPPRLSMTYSYPQAGRVTTQKAEDPAAMPPSPGIQLKTTLAFPVKLTFDTNGMFVVDLQIDDRDTSRVRLYHDEIPVEPVVPCSAPANQPTPSPQAIPAQGSPPQTPPNTSPNAPTTPPTPQQRQTMSPIRVERSSEDDVGQDRREGGR